MSWSLGVAKKISKLPSRRGLQKNHAQLQFYKRIPCNWKCWLKILLQCGSKASQARIKWAPEPANHANHPSKVKLHEQADLVKQQARQLTSQPTNQPILKPLLQSCWSLPTNQPSNHPTNQPTNQQTNQITNQPANQPTNRGANIPNCPLTEKLLSQRTKQIIEAKSSCMSKLT